MKNKRILIFYMSPRSGHYIAAKSLKNCFYHLYPNCDVMDVNFLNYTNPVIERILFRIYMRVIKSAPTIWDFMYDNKRIMDRMAWMQELSRILNKTKMKSLINDFKPDAILNTQCFPCGVLSVFKEQGEFVDIPNIAVITDYVVNAYWLYDHVDRYIVADDSIAVKLMDEGIPKEKIRSFGIPVDIRYRLEHDRGVLKAKFNLEPDKKTLLVMGGNYGYGNIKKLVFQLCRLSENIQIVVITGRNEKLYRRLYRLRSRLGKPIRVCEFVENVDEFMDVADIILTKPGGITTAECLVKRLPMIIINPIPGQETRNCEYLVERHVALSAKNETHAVSLVADCLSHPEKLDVLKANIEKLRRPSASIDIVDMVMNECARKG